MITSLTEISCARPVIKGAVTKSHKRRYHRGDRLVLRCQSGKILQIYSVSLNHATLHLITEQAAQLRRWSANPTASGRAQYLSVTRNNAENLARTVDHARAATSVSARPVTAVVIASMVDITDFLFCFFVLLFSYCYFPIVFFLWFFPLVFFFHTNKSKESPPSRDVMALPYLFNRIFSCIFPHFAHTL